MNRYEPRKSIALDGKAWWCVYDTINKQYSTLLCHGKYKTRKSCQYAIESFQHWYTIK